MKLIYGLILFFVLFFCGNTNGQVHSPRSFTAQIQARKKAEEAQKKEKDFRATKEQQQKNKIERIETMAKASSQDLENLKQLMEYYRSVSVGSFYAKRLADQSQERDTIKIIIDANATMDALGYMRKLTVLQTLPDGVLCQNESYNWENIFPFKNILKTSVDLTFESNKKNGELFFLKCDTSEMYDGLEFCGFVQPDGFFSYLSPTKSDTNLGTPKKIRQYRCATQAEIDAIIMELGDREQYVTYPKR